MYSSPAVIKTFIFCVATKLSFSTALEIFDQRNETKNTQNSQTNVEQYGRQLRRTTKLYSSLDTSRTRDDTAVADGQTTRLNQLDQTNIVFEQDLEQLKEELSSSTSVSNEQGVYQLNDQEQDESVLQLCRRMDLNFAKAANGRVMSGGEFVRGEWFHRYGLNIYAEGHDGKNNLHPMIFDSSNIESNGLVENEDLFALLSPNIDCGGRGIGTGGKEGNSGENCHLLGNILIPSRKPGSPNLYLKTRGSSYQPPLGGVLIFEFDKKTKVDNIELLNIGRFDQITAIHNDGSFEKIPLVSLGQNGFQKLHLKLDNVERLYINLHSFGAVTGLDLCVVVE